MRYYTDYPNQVHFLNVSLSRHNYMVGDQKFSHQRENLRVTWEQIFNSSYAKNILINYVISDHFSGLYYAESHPASEPIAIESFLFRAWAKKKYFSFCGYPKNLFVPHTVLKVFPQLSTFLQSGKTIYQEVGSGFASGVSAIKDWEKYFRYYVIYNNLTLNEFRRTIFLINNFIHTSRFTTEWSKQDKWKQGQLDPLEIPDDYEKFVKLFYKGDSDPSIMPFKRVYWMRLQSDISESPDYKTREEMFDSSPEHYRKKKEQEKRLKCMPGFRRLFKGSWEIMVVAVNANESGLIDGTNLYEWCLYCDTHNVTKHYSTLTACFKEGDHSEKWCEGCKILKAEMAEKAKASREVQALNWS